MPRVAHPDWLHKKVREKEDKFRQKKLADMFSSLKKDNVLKRNGDVVETSDVTNEEIVEDLEDLQNGNSSIKGHRPVVRFYEANNTRNSVENISEVNPQQTDNSAKENQMQIDIDRNVDYQGWLEIKKRKWKDTLNMRKKQRYSALNLQIKAQINFKIFVAWLNVFSLNKMSIWRHLN